LLRADLELTGVRRKIVSFLKEKVEQFQADGVIFELRGDVSSAVTAHLCVEALSTRRVAGFIMPDLRVISAEDLSDARKVAGELCLATREIDIAPIHKTLMKSLEGNLTAEDDLRARIRMALLYYQADTQNRLVVGSADRSEFLLGGFADCRDCSADLLPLAELYRSEIRRLGEVLGINRKVVVKKGERSRAWHHSETAIYLERDAVDQILRFWLDLGLDVEMIAAKTGTSPAEVEAIISRYKSSLHNREGPDVCSLH
jgi:NAD+ synthase